MIHLVGIELSGNIIKIKDSTAAASSLGSLCFIVINDLHAAITQIIQIKSLARLALLWIDCLDPAVLSIFF